MNDKNKILRVKPWDKYLWNCFYKILSVLSLVFSLIFIPPVEAFLGNMTNNIKIWKVFLAIYFSLLLFFYFFLWFRMSRKKSIVLQINRNEIEIRQGDIFLEPDNIWKVIGVNEYFDTHVGRNVGLVSSESLHGKYLNKFYQEIADVKSLDIRMQKELINIKSKTNKKRKLGKKEKYPLGTVFCDMEDNRKYILTAFARTDKDNRAYLSISDYIIFLINFWNEIDKIYDGYSVVIPLFGSGIVRFKEQEITHQDLLELILWTFKSSQIKMSYNTKVKILLYGNDIEKVNLYRLKQVSTT